MSTLRALPELAAAWRTQWWPAARLQALQASQLARILEHAARHVPYYRRTGLPPPRLPPEQALLHYPYLCKQDIQAAGTDLLAEGYRPERLHVSRTSGSTGEPTTTWFDEDSWRFTRHVLKWRRVLAAVRPWRLRLLLVSEGGLPVCVTRSSPLPGLFELETVHISVPAQQALERVREFRPTAIYAFPSWLRELIDAAGEHDLELPAVACVMTSSEVLTGSDRDAISRAFSARIQDVYGTTEFKDIAWQCREGRYHINAESVWVEIDAPRGEIGEVVLTGLVNRAMPLIRMRSGDLARWLPGECPCGRASPALGDIQGRVMEMMELPGARRISPYLLTTSIESDKAIRNYVIEQHSPGHIVVRYRPRPGGHVRESALADRVRRVLEGSDVQVECRCDPLLPSTGETGKRSIYRRLYAHA